MTTTNKLTAGALPPDVQELADELERELFDRHGPMIANEALYIALGYRSMNAFRQALVRKTVPIPIMALPSRKGKFALVKDLARWLAVQRETAAATKNGGPP